MVYYAVKMKMTHPETIIFVMMKEERKILCEFGACDKLITEPRRWSTIVNCFCCCCCQKTCFARLIHHNILLELILIYINLLFKISIYLLLTHNEFVVNIILIVVTARKWSCLIKCAFSSLLFSLIHFETIFFYFSWYQLNELLAEN